MRTVILGLLLALSIPAFARDEPSVSSSSSAPGASGIGGERVLGVGVHFGEPLAVTAKWWMSPELALTFLVGGWIHPHQGAVGGVDLTFHLRNLVSRRQVEIGAYFGGGVGAGVRQRNDYFHAHEVPWPHWHRHDVQEPLLYVRPVVGGAAWFTGAPIEVAVEIAPAVVFAPEREINIGGGVSGRYYF